MIFVFKEFKNGEYKVVMIYVKYVWGMMMCYLIKEKCIGVDDLKGFNVDGYLFDVK